MSKICAKFSERVKVRGSRIHLVCLIFAVSLLATVIVHADVETLSYEYDLQTISGGWEVASLPVDGYINPTMSGGKYNNIGGRNGATTWSKISRNYTGDWDRLNWNDAVQGNRGTWNTYSDWVAVTGDDESKVDNGFYAFKYRLTAAEGVGIDSLAAQLNINYSADDYIAAIYANGTALLQKDLVNKAVVGNDINEDGDWLKFSTGAFDVNLLDGVLDLVFVVHNTNAAGSLKDNPMGLYVNGSLHTSIEMIGPTPPSQLTPEPATLAVLGLGLAGLVGACRRRKR